MPFIRPLPALALALGLVAGPALAQTAQLTDTAEVIFNIYGRQEAGNLLE